MRLPSLVWITSPSLVPGTIWSSLVESVQATVMSEPTVERAVILRSIRPTRNSLAGRRSCIALSVVGYLCAAALAAPAAKAQQFPGMVLSQPAPMQQAAPPQAPPAPAKAKPKPKPKPVVATDTSAEPTTSPSKSSGEHIVMLVNDDPITAREIEQRSRFLSASSNSSEKAREIFQRLAQSEAVNTKFRAMAEEIIRQNQGKPKEQIMALIERRKAELGASLQRQAAEQARGVEMPKYRQAAIDEIIEEKLKLQEAKKESVEVTDDETNRVIKGIAERNK